jgi:hypothetical protein
MCQIRCDGLLAYLAETPCFYLEAYQVGAGQQGNPLSVGRYRPGSAGFEGQQEYR